LRGSDLILHAGDIGKPEILDELRNLSPVVAIRGNVDTSPWAKKLKETELVETAAAPSTLFTTSTNSTSPLPLPEFTLSSSAIPFTRSIRKDGRTLHNPGSAGPRRFTSPFLSRVSAWPT